MFKVLRSQRGLRALSQREVNSQCNLPEHEPDASSSCEYFWYYASHQASLLLLLRH